MAQSVSAQLKAPKDYAKSNGYSVAREYVDEAESGRVADRPQFREMIEEGSRPNAPFEVILVWKFSRFPRKREHAVAFKSMLRRKGVRVVSITEPPTTLPPASPWRPSSRVWMSLIVRILRKKCEEPATRRFLVSDGVAAEKDAGIVLYQLRLDAYLMPPTANEGLRILSDSIARGLVSDPQWTLWSPSASAPR